MTVTSVRAVKIRACAAGLLRFATPEELDVLLDDPLSVQAETSYGQLNKMVVEVLLRRDRGRERLIDALFDSGEADSAVFHPTSSLLGRLLDLDDPEVNGMLFFSAAPRNLLRQLAHQTSRRDGATPVPLPDYVREYLREGRLSERQLTALLYSSDPDMAGDALRRLGRGADPHGVAWACRRLLEAGRTDELRELLETDALPLHAWGSERHEPSVSAYVGAALTNDVGVAQLRGLTERTRRPEWLRSVAELADTLACEPWRGRPALVHTIVHRRHPDVPRVDWPALVEDEPRRRRGEGPLPYRVARLMALRVDTPPELLRLAIMDHPGVAPFVPNPTRETLAYVCERLPVVGGQVVVKVAGNGFVAGTVTAEEIAAILPPDVLDLYARELWLPGLRGTAAVRTMTGRAGDVPLRPFFVDETGHGARHRLRSPQTRAHWDAASIYGPQVIAALGNRGDAGLSADEVLSMVAPDAVLAPSGAMPDMRVLLRLAELVHQHLGGRPEAWMVALRLLQDGFVGTLPELLVAAGAVAA